MTRAQVRPTQVHGMYVNPNSRHCSKLVGVYIRSSHIRVPLHRSRGRFPGDRIRLSRIPVHLTTRKRADILHGSEAGRRDVERHAFRQCRLQRQGGQDHRQHAARGKRAEATSPT